MARTRIPLSLLISMFVCQIYGAATSNTKAGGGEALQDNNLPATESKNQSNGTDVLQSVAECENSVPVLENGLAQDCYDLYLSNVRSGMYEIYPKSLGGLTRIAVYCDMDIDAGGWTVIQRRDAQFKPRTDFYRNWQEYKSGFGLLDQEFWLGLDNIRALTLNREYEIRIDLSDFLGKVRFAKYNSFAVGPETKSYPLELGTYSGDAGEQFLFNNNSRFTTKDEDNDSDSGNCAQQRRGAWWHSSCTRVNLNGYPVEGSGQSYGIFWRNFPSSGENYSLKTADMKIRPILY